MQLDNIYIIIHKAVTLQAAELAQDGSDCSSEYASFISATDEVYISTICCANTQY